MASGGQRWQRLRAYLDAHGATQLGDAAGRIGAVLALLVERGDDLELVLTKRRDDLPTHPGQVSFPGGRREPGESTTAAALREAHEEIGLRTDTVEVLGHLPPFFVPPSRFWLAPVVARWVRPHPLRAQETEVAALVRAPLAHLMDKRRWRKVGLSTIGWSLAWELDGEHVLWGATAAVVAVLLDAMEPDWRGGTEPAELPDEVGIMPWLALGSERRVLPPQLDGVVTSPRDRVPAPDPSPPAARDVAGAGAAIAAAVQRLRARPERIVVLAGGGHTGAAGAAAASVLLRRGLGVTVVAADPGRFAHDEGVEAFTGSLPPADLYVDALVGGGLRGRLGGTPLAMLLALRVREAPILAVDLPTGLHPTEGLVGDTLAATVTLALAGVWPAVRNAGLAPFVGDLYLWDGRGKRIVRLVAGPRRATVPGSGWRE
jgi:8-oxo-dGTP pyrophosphatase MutT (NUDIX family)/NAD(P)H-hydrate repair Nnr-like enzyme with NAD(P)H-hydrate epimerase domain